MSPARRQDGFTMVELLIVCVISLIVFGATLSAWTSIYRSNRALEGQQDNAEAARVALDRAARQLRNLANPTVNAVTTIDRAQAYDFIFQTSDPSKTWVRYCLQTSGGGTSLANATLWEAESPTAVTAAMRTACPGTGWTRSAAVVSGVTNQKGGIDRPAFKFECAIAAAATCPASSSEYQKITNVGIALWVDANSTDRVHEIPVNTGVFLRNQNESPTALPTAAKVAKERELLNGSSSTDPEGRTLEYYWYEDTAPTAAAIAATPCTSAFADSAWRGVTFDKRFPSGTAGQTKTFYLLVRDPGCLTSLASVTFTVPT
jgi:prepilin-type N-terminal cleavage/methylation domain-containing protein